MASNDYNRVARLLSEQAADECERLNLAAEINARDTAGPELDPVECRKLLEQEHGQVWDSFQLARDFDVEAFSPPLVVAVRRCDGVRGTLVFQHEPRFYWAFNPA
jgi:hypothetical protein